MRLGDLPTPDSVLSTGLMLERRGRLLFAVAERDIWRHEEGRLLVPFFGIGGRLEPGESFPAAARREAREEASLEVTLADSEATVVFQDEQRRPAVRLAPADRPRPCLVWQHNAWLARHGVTVPYFVAVYRAAAQGDPRPGSEIPALLDLPPTALAQAARLRLTAAGLDAAGAWLIARDHPRLELPPAAVFEPIGTARLLGRL